VPPKRILIADDDAELVKFLAARCEALGLYPLTALDALDALNLAHEAAPDLICLDLRMPHGDGLAVLEMLAGDEELSAVPAIVLSGDTREETLRRCRELRARHVGKTSDVWPALEAAIRELLEPAAPGPAEPCVAPAAPSAATTSVPTQAGPEPPWVLCIDDDEDFSHALRLRLESHGVAVIRAFHGVEGVRFAFARAPDVILLDWEMPNGRGDYVLDRIRSASITRNTPVIVITGKHDRMLERRMLNLGADHFLYKPLDFDKLLAALAKHIDVLPRPACE
jgi:DNA-binding response OmpR family regulator